MKTSKIIFLFYIILAVQTKIQAQTTADHLFTTYYAIKDALVAGKSNIATEQSKNLLSAISQIHADSFDLKQKEVWKLYAEKLEYDARHISESTELSHQREHFAGLSKNMYELVKGLHINGAIVYRQYCPMKKLYWLSESPVIKNPYYGNQMLTCGKVTDTIKPVLN